MLFDPALDRKVSGILLMMAGIDHRSGIKRPTMGFVNGLSLDLGFQFGYDEWKIFHFRPIIILQLR